MSLDPACWGAAMSSQYIGKTQDFDVATNTMTTAPNRPRLGLRTVQEANESLSDGGVHVEQCSVAPQLQILESHPECNVEASEMASDPAISVER